MQCLSGMSVFPRSVLCPPLAVHHHHVVHVTHFSARSFLHSSPVPQRSSPRLPILSPEDPMASTRPPRLTVMGIGGAGGNVINNMIEEGVQGVDIIAANTDGQALLQSKAAKKLQLGFKRTRGYGAGAKPEVGKEAAEETIKQVMEDIRGSDMLFLTAGMGGGTGTGGTPVIASGARDEGILTVGMVTTPFRLEGDSRMKVALQGIAELQRTVNTLIVIDNEKLVNPANDRLEMKDAYKKVDLILSDGITSLTDLILNPGKVNLDFADVLTVMEMGGRASLGVGEASGKERAQAATHQALYNPLSSDIGFRGAKGVLLHVQGGADLRLAEVSEIGEIVKNAVGPRAKMIFGHTESPGYNDRVKVSLVLTGLYHEDENWFRRNMEKLKFFVGW